VDIIALSYFVAVAETESFTQGAERAQIAQSTASSAVARLERETNQALFIRIGHRIELTRAGHTLLDAARRILDLRNAVLADLRALDGTMRGTVVIGTVLSTGTFDFAAVLNAIRAAHPHIRLRVEFSPSPMERQLVSVLDGSYDLALVPEPPSTPVGVTLMPVGVLQLLPVAPLDVDLPHRALECAELADLTWIDFPPGWANRQRVDEMFAAHGVERDVAIEVGDTTTALDLVRNGCGAAFLPHRIVRDSKHVRILDMDIPLPARTLVLARRDRRQSPATEAVYTLMSQAVPAP
jgi:DNA-binding transcriptional LysR family regulator